jgi:hypothetical protein
MDEHDWGVVWFGLYVLSAFPMVLYVEECLKRPLRKRKPDIEVAEK